MTHTHAPTLKTSTPPATLTDPTERDALERLRAISPIADPQHQLGLPPSRIPRHIAIIMDGNGRWANQRNLPRPQGHRAGAPRVRETLERAAHLGVAYLTLYSFSTENWRRPAEEISALMSLYVYYMAKERDELVANNIRLNQIGSRDRLAHDALEELDRTLEATAHCTGPTLTLAVNYSAREEITDAARAIAQKAANGQLNPDDITQNTVAQHLHTAGMPDPDLLIRTGGEMRVSNYLLWQISYAEIVVTDTLWPDFTAQHLDDAIKTYATRNRRFGGVEQPSA